MRHWLIAVCLTLSAATTSAQIFPVDRNTAWSTGVVGGIPARATICATLLASTYAGVDASAAINSAIAACALDQTVLLSAGTFQANDLILLNKRITLRGAGAGVTTIVKTNGAHARTSRFVPVDPGSYMYEAEPNLIIGPQRWNVQDDSTSQNLSSDGAKGATSVTIASGTGFAAGQIVLLDELSGASWQATPTGFPDMALVWKGDRVAWNMHLPVQMYQDDSGTADMTGPYQTLSPRTLPDSMSWFARQDRPTNELHEVASVAGNVITFTTPLHISYRTSHTAQLTRYTGPNVHVKGAGVEAITFVGGADGSVRFTHCSNCWAKNLEVTQWIGEGIAVDGSYRVEIRESFLHEGSWPEPGGAGYALSLSHATTEMLFENNISYDACKNMVARSSGAGSVIAYNYADDPWDFDTPPWQEVSLNASHMAGPHHVLFEGNFGANFDSDYTHGNAIDMVVFRNHLVGQRRSFTDTANIRAVGLGYGSWWDTFIGNVLGTSGAMSAFAYEAPAMAGGSSDWTGPNIWQLGYDPERWGMYVDPDTMATVIRDGNWDFKTNSVHWHTTPATFTIPSSLYLSSIPAFFGAASWPWVNPLTGVTTLLPAKARFDAGTPNNTTPPTGGGSVSVPNVIAMTTATASSTITGAGLTVGTITMMSSESFVAGIVMGQSPTAGASVSPGTAVNLTVSSGPLSAPATHWEMRYCPNTNPCVGGIVSRQGDF